MPKPKYPIPKNNFPRFIDEYLRTNSVSSNEFAKELNKLLPKELMIPIRVVLVKSF